MAVEGGSNKTEVMLSAGATKVDLTFYFDYDSDLQVYVDGVVQSGNYTVQGAGQKLPLGSVTFNAPFNEAKKITILRVLPLTQPVDLKNGGVMDAEVVENMGDRQVMMVQQLSEQIERAVIQPVGQKGIDSEAFIKDINNKVAQVSTNAALSESNKNASLSNAVAAANSATSAAQELGKVTAEGNKQVARVTTEGDTQVQRIINTGNYGDISLKANKINAQLTNPTILKQDSDREGGEIVLQRADNQTQTHDTILDTAAHALMRVTESGGAFRGAHLPVEECGANLETKFSLLDPFGMPLNNKRIVIGSSPVPNPRPGQIWLKPE